MNNEDYVSYELALKLKECGFDEPCDHYYTNGYANPDPNAEPLSQNPTENCDNENPISNPHTEMQTGEKYPDRNLCDKLIQRGFKNHNRLHLAAMAMQAIISRGKGYDAQETAVTALEFADALIAEAEKGGKQ